MKTTILIVCLLLSATQCKAGGQNSTFYTFTSISMLDLYQTYQFSKGKRFHSNAAPFINNEGMIMLTELAMAKMIAAGITYYTNGNDSLVIAPFVGVSGYVVIIGYRF